jgi:drug/metabolite transporter (DMT)-like permease
MPAGGATVWLIGVVLSTAVLHAGWNAVLRHGRDALWSSAVITLGYSGAAIVWLPFVPLPGKASVPFIAVSLATHFGARVFLGQAYRWGELGAVYPIARGSAPLLVTGAAAVFAGEHLTPQMLGAISVISFGIVALSQVSLDRGIPRPAVLFALATALAIASYTIVDGIGARRAGNAFSYVLWLATLEIAPWPFVILASRGRLHGRFAAPGDGWRALAGGAASLLAYALVVWAMTMAPLGMVSALRETSVVFAALIGWLFLNERWSWRRIGACTIIAAGVIWLAMLR